MTTNRSQLVTASLVLGLVLFSRAGTMSSSTGAVSGRPPAASAARVGAAAVRETAAQVSAARPEKEAYFGDLHVHTSWSLDAFTMGGNRDDPSVAYRYGRG